MDSQILNYLILIAITKESNNINLELVVYTIVKIKNYKYNLFVNKYKWKLLCLICSIW